MPIALELNAGRVPVKIWTADVEAEARRQLENVSRLPIVHGHVAAMPDVHAGIGATVGSVIPTKGAIVPAAVGVDIGCGVNAVRLSLTASELPESLGRIRSAIESAVPVGFEMHPASKGRGSAREKAAKALEPGLRHVAERTPQIRSMQKDFDQTWVRQLGSLGGGNHFIEVCLDEEQRVWVMLHSGSRGIGNVIGRHFIERARREMERSDTQLPDRDLAWLNEGSKSFEQYVDAVHWAQDYAMANRREMMRAKRSIATTTTWRASITSAPTSWSRARAPSARAWATWASSPAAWARSRSSCAARAIPNRFAPAPTARGGA
jgi:tRNA-splicing ligase RtcB